MTFKILASKIFIFGFGLVTLLLVVVRLYFNEPADVKPNNQIGIVSPKGGMPPPKAIVVPEVEEGGSESAPFNPETPVIQGTLEVESGNRAITIPIDLRTSVEGHAQPGSRVDVVLTLVDAEGQLSSIVIVQAARVLSLGGKTKAEAKQNGTFFTKTITLEMSPEDSLKITSARELGILSLALRHQSDVKELNVEYNSNKIITGKVEPKKCDPGAVSYCPWRPGYRIPLGTLKEPTRCDGPVSPPAGDLSPCAG